jgi:FSR family fosmidomycin resistance protein-like MFS transporter
VTPNAAWNAAVKELGAGLSGVLPTYALSWLALLLSGVGIPMFHPAAGKAARRAAGDQTAAMSVFAVGGRRTRPPACKGVGVGGHLLYRYPDRTGTGGDIECDRGTRRRPSRPCTRAAISR